MVGCWERYLWFYVNLQDFIFLLLWALNCVSLCFSVYVCEGGGGGELFGTLDAKCKRNILDISRNAKKKKSLNFSQCFRIG